MYNNEVDVSDLNVKLQILADIKTVMPSVMIVTSIHTICEVMDGNEIFKDMLPAVRKLLRWYLTIPITSSTAERTFSALKYV